MGKNNQAKTSPASKIQRIDWWVSEAGVGGRQRVGEMGEGSKNVQTINTSYKIIKSWGYNVHHGDDS